MDFALAARPIPGTTPVTIDRTRHLPLTITSPAVLLGVRSTHLDADGQFISQDEMEALSQVMRPHLDLFCLLQHNDDVIIPPYAPSVTSAPTLFCTYLKKGFLHVLAFALSDGDNDDVQLDGHLLDSLPISLQYDEDADFNDRMRIVLALFTLQRQVVKICEAWSTICWPHDILIEEHAAIVEVTGVISPTPTADLPPPEKGDDDDSDFDFGIEDHPNFLKGEIAKSVQRVTKWLADLEENDSDP